MKYDQAWIINWSLITYPYVWKCNKTFLNYILSIIDSMATEIFVKILAHFSNPTGALTVAKPI